MFRLTTAAAEQVVKAAKQGGAEGMSLRVAAARGQDGAFDYRMGFDASTEEDIRFKSEGIDIVIAPEYVPLLDDTVMDFVQLDDGQHQFVFLNPKDPNYKPAADT
jgi:iron-sulfur cluster assembly protein